MLNPRRILSFYGKVLVAAVALLGVLSILAILAELSQERIRLINIIRDILPGIVAVGTALFLASNFVASLYDLKNWREGAGHIVHCIFDRPGFPPFLVASGGKIGASNDNVLVRVGGAGGILTYADSALVLEQGGRLTRVIAPGTFDSLGRFEKVHDVIDVRPMHWEYKVEALSKEGIPVTAAADITFQIDTDGNEPTNDKPYPATEEAIFKASTCRWMRHPRGSDDDQYFDWARRMIIGNTEGGLRSIIARYPLDALVGLEDIPASSAAFQGQDTQESSERDSPRKAIRRELEAVLQQSASDLGLQINKVRLGAIVVDERVTKQWLEAWKNELQDRAIVQKTAGAAKREQERKTARARAQVDIITATAQALQRSGAADACIPPRIMVMRLLEVFDHLEVNPYTYLPGQAIRTLRELREMVGSKPV
jgi:regulator of protease activity HflC (stomatin/prohibitin superfamily)